MILHDWVLSPNCYKVRLMAALTDQPLTLRAVNFYPGQEHLSEVALALNPGGTLPVLEDGDLVLTESAAILMLLGTRAGAAWVGTSPEDAAQVQGWLSFAEALNTSAGQARAIDMIGAPGDLATAQAAGRGHLRHLELALSDRRIAGATWLVGDAPSIADIACFPHVMLAPDGGLSLAPYPAIRLWSRALRSLPGFVEMPGIHRMHELSPDPVMETEAR